MPHKPLPFLTRREHRDLIESCTRTEDGCLLFLGTDPGRPNLVKIRGHWYCASRLMWSEHYAMTQDLMHQLEVNDVAHIAECPHPSDHKNGQHPTCIEPTHLELTIHGRHPSATERKKIYGGQK